MKLKDIGAILAHGTFDDLVGVIEDYYFEAKSAPYPIDKSYGRRELAKDVVAFANADGGMILIGAQTDTSPVHIGDEIKAIHPIPQNLINHQQYHDIIRDWVHPHLEEVDVSWYPCANDNERGVVAIMIPKQTPHHGPFLVSKTLDEDNPSKQVGFLFGYFERRLAGNEPARIQDLHVLLKDGRRVDELVRRFDAVDQELMTLRSIIESETSRPKISSSVTTEELSNRLANARRTANLTSCPVFYLAAITTPATDLSGIFVTDSAITRTIDHPPKLRPGGFDLSHEQRSRIIEGRSRGVMIPSWKLLEVYRDGTIIYAVEANSSPCWWGSSHTPKNGLIINPLALIETIYTFAKFTRIVFGEATPPIQGAVYHLGFSNLTAGNVPTRLMPGPLTSWGWNVPEELKTAPRPDACFEVKWEQSEIHPETISFVLAREVYRWFGFEDDKIPYVSNNKHEPAIDPNEMTRPTKW